MEEKTMLPLKRILFHILAFFAACIVFMIVFTIVYLVISFLGVIPFLRVILFAPGDVFWSRIGLSPLIAVIAAAVVSESISGTARPVMLFGSIVYIFFILLMLFSGDISGETIVQDAIIAFVCIWQFRVSPTLKDAKIAMINKGKE